MATTTSEGVRCVTCDRGPERMRYVPGVGSRRYTDRPEYWFELPDGGRECSECWRKAHDVDDPTVTPPRSRPAPPRPRLPRRRRDDEVQVDDACGWCGRTDGLDDMQPLHSRVLPTPVTILECSRCRSGIRRHGDAFELAAAMRGKRVRDEHAERELRVLAQRLGVDPPDDRDEYVSLSDLHVGRVIEAGEPVDPPDTPWGW